jgi:nucleotide-binding universal stress UspA family protein
LVEPGGRLTLLSVFDVQTAFVAGTVGTSASPLMDENVQREAAEEAVRQARLAAPDAEGKIVRGRATEELIREAERERDGLIVVGSHGKGRAAGIVIGSTATELVHKAPCSVLIARKGSDEFPRSVGVGVDGSPESALAHEVAARLSARLGVRLRAVLAHGGKGVESTRVAEIAGDAREEVQDHPVDGLVAVSRDVDLLVVGSRGLHGLRSLGSVSERVAHRAACSVLVVREAPWQ